MPWQVAFLVVVAVFFTAMLAFVILYIVQERQYHQTLWLEEAKRMHRMGKICVCTNYGDKLIVPTNKTRLQFEEWREKWDGYENRN